MGPLRLVGLWMLKMARWIRLPCLLALPVGDHDDDDQQHDDSDDPLQRMPQGRRWISGRRSASGRDGEHDQEAGQHKLQAEPEGQRMVTPGAEAGDGRTGRADPGQ